MPRLRVWTPVLQDFEQSDHGVHCEGSHFCFSNPHSLYVTLRGAPHPLSSVAVSHSSVVGQQVPPCAGGCSTVRVRACLAPSFLHLPEHPPQSDHSDILQSTGHGRLGHSTSSKLLVHPFGSTLRKRVILPAASPSLLAQVLVHSPQAPQSAALQSSSSKSSEDTPTTRPPICIKL